MAEPLLHLRRPGLHREGGARFCKAARMASDPSLEETTADMRRHWDAFAAEDPMFYIASQREDWTREAFFAEGSQIVEEIVAQVGGRIENSRALEVGCGLGRLLVPLSAHFEHVDGIDIAPEMIEAAKASGMPSNVSLWTGSGSDLQPLPEDHYDFVLSQHVFQHIPDERIVAGYLREIARVMKPAGLAWLYFDTRPAGLGVRALQALPDRLLPRTRRQFIRRYRLAPARLKHQIEAAGLAVVEERGRGTSMHVLALVPAAHPDAAGQVARVSG